MKVKDLLHQLTKKITFHSFTNKKILLIKQDTEISLDEEEFINLNLSKEIFELIMLSLPYYKSRKPIKKTINNIGELLMLCTDGKEELIPKKQDVKSNKLIRNAFRDQIFGGFNNCLYSPDESPTHGNYSSYRKYIMDKFEDKQGNYPPEILEIRKKKFLSSLASHTNTHTHPNVDTTMTNINSEENPELISQYELAKLEQINLQRQKEKEKLKIYKTMLKQNAFLHDLRFGASSAKVEADPKKLEDLLLMGFEEDRCRKALTISKNSIEHATELLLGGSNFELYDNILQANDHLNINESLSNRIIREEIKAKLNLQKEMEKEQQKDKQVKHIEEPQESFSLSYANYFNEELKSNYHNKYL